MYGARHRPGAWAQRTGLAVPLGVPITLLIAALLSLSLVVPVAAVDDAVPSADLLPAATASGPGRFTPAGSLAEARFNHTSTLLPDGHVVIIGGVVYYWEDRLASAEVWDPATASFGPARGGPLLVARVLTG